MTATTITSKIDCTLSYQLAGLCDFVFMVQAAQGDDQTVIEELLEFDPPAPFRGFVDPASGNRHVRMQSGPGSLTLRYTAVVERT